MLLDSIKLKVRDFQKRTNFGRSDEENFVPWWLQQNFRLSDEEATMSCSDTLFDLGVHGVYCQEKDGETVFSVVQGIYSEDINLVPKAINSVTKFLPRFATIIKNIESAAENGDILAVRLKQKLQSPKSLSKKPLDINVYILSLTSAEESEMIAKAAKSKNELFASFENEFSSAKVSLSISLLNIDNLVELGKIDSRRAATPFEIHFDGSDEIVMNNSHFLSGFGKIADLVNLYETKGNQLFDKNVRLYLYSKKNEIQGPAGKIKETLEHINSGKIHPEKFAFLHNGVSIYSTKINTDKKNKTVTLANPSVLNGCQTIKSAYFFYQDALKKNKLDIKTWEAIPLSIRLIATTDKELWREVAEANNRQNSMTAAALRANDEVQITIENRLNDLNIFYERQEGAYENLYRENKEKFVRRFVNSPREPIYIQVLAQTLVCCSNLPLAYALRVSEIFESRNLYDKVFSAKNLRDLKYVTLAYNLRRLIENAIKNSVPGNATRIYADFKSSKFKDLFTRIALKTIIKEGRLEQYIAQYGQAVLTRQSKLASDFIDELIDMIKTNTILQKVTDVFRYYDNASETYYWHKPGNQNLCDEVLSKLRLNNVEIFA